MRKRVRNIAIAGFLVSSFAFRTDIVDSVRVIKPIYANEEPIATEDSWKDSSIEQRPVNRPKCHRKHSPPAMSSNFEYFTLAEVIPLTRDVAMFRFLLSSPERILSIEPCTNIEARFFHKGQFREAVTRHFTPIVSNTARGYFDILVRKRPNGVMSEFLFGLTPGDQLEFRLAPRRLRYQANKWKEVGMICGGTGITPMLQILRHALAKESCDQTKFRLLYCNRSEEHIPLKPYLDELQSKFPNRFEVAYNVDLSMSPDTWKGFQGDIDSRMLHKSMPKASSENILLVCGPDGFVEKLAGVKVKTSSSQSVQYRQPLHNTSNSVDKIDGILRSLGYKSEHVFVF